MKITNHIRTAAALTSLLLAGCNILNPIKKLECKTILSSGITPYEKGSKYRLILNTRTGEIYEKDELSGKLELINGRTSDIEYHYNIRTLIADNKWKMELISRKFIPSIYADKAGKALYTLNLKNMKIKKISHSFTNGAWKEIGVSEGECIWTTPETTKIIKKSNNQ